MCFQVFCWKLRGGGGGGVGGVGGWGGCSGLGTCWRVQGLAFRAWGYSALNLPCKETRDLNSHLQSKCLEGPISFPHGFRFKN